MKLTLFSAKPYDQKFFESNKLETFSFDFYSERLSIQTVELAKGSDAVCIFTNDNADSSVVRALHDLNVKAIALRCAGFDNVDIEEAQRLNMTVVRVPTYSPEAVAEHAASLLLTLNRKIHKAYNRVREGNFALEGLMGHNIHGKTVGVIGLGHIGLAFCRIMKGFGCKVIAFDLVQSEIAQKLGIEFLPLNSVIEASDIISLHCPLNKNTYHLINDERIKKAKNGVKIINTSRGGIIDTQSVITHLKSGKIGGLGIDVYEKEKGMFFEDLSNTIIQDDLFRQLASLPNVIITGHQAFFTHEAMNQIVGTTLNNLHCIKNGKTSGNEVLTS